MSIFSSTSRYLKYAATGIATDRRGRTVAYVGPARVPPQAELGKHRRHEDTGRTVVLDEGDEARR